MAIHPWTLAAVLATTLVAGGCAQRGPTQVSAQAPTEPALLTKPTVGQELGAVADNQLEIPFADGSAKVSPAANRQFDIAARLFRDVGPARMFAIGHSDGRGDEFGNVVLAAQRARAVKQALVARGIPADRVFIQSVGESEPLNRSEPNDRGNRRVVVKWQVL